MDGVLALFSSSVSVLQFINYPIPETSCRILSRDRSILDSLILEAKRKWVSVRSDKIDIYAASEGSVRYPSHINENNLSLSSPSKIWK